MKLPPIYSRAILAPLVYRFALGRLIDRIGADVVLNLGNLIVSTTARQLYVFGWPYALNVHPKVWKTMSVPDWLRRRTKLLLLERHFRRADIVVAQTQEIRDVLSAKYGLADVRVINNAVTLEPTVLDRGVDFALPDGVRLLCPCVYYPHKNLEVLLDLGSRIKTRGLDYRIVTTVDPSAGAARRFVEAIGERGLGDIIRNVGQVPLHRMQSLYAQCHALLMPTLLESFSIVYLEAMHHRLPIFTSDMWFARAVCGNAARYFDPFDADDILRSLEQVLSDVAAKNALVEAGTRQLASYPSWPQNFATFQSLIAELLGKSEAHADATATPPGSEPRHNRAQAR